MQAAGEAGDEMADRTPTELVPMSWLKMGKGGAYFHILAMVAPRWHMLPAHRLPMKSWPPVPF